MKDNKIIRFTDNLQILPGVNSTNSSKFTNANEKRLSLGFVGRKVSIDKEGRFESSIKAHSVFTYLLDAAKTASYVLLSFLSLPALCFRQCMRAEISLQDNQVVDIASRSLASEKPELDTPENPEPVKLETPKLDQPKTHIEQELKEIVRVLNYNFSLYTREEYEILKSEINTIEQKLKNCSPASKEYKSLQAELNQLCQPVLQQIHSTDQDGKLKEFTQTMDKIVSLFSSNPNQRKQWFSSLSAEVKYENFYLTALHFLHDCHKLVVSFPDGISSKNRRSFENELKKLNRLIDNVFPSKILGTDLQNESLKRVCSTTIRNLEFMPLASHVYATRVEETEIIPLLEKAWNTKDEAEKKEISVKIAKASQLQISAMAVDHLEDAHNLLWAMRNLVGALPFPKEKKEQMKAAIVPPEKDFKSFKAMLDDEGLYSLVRRVFRDCDTLIASNLKISDTKLLRADSALFMIKWKIDDLFPSDFRGIEWLRNDLCKRRSELHQKLKALNNSEGVERNL